MRNKALLGAIFALTPLLLAGCNEETPSSSLSSEVIHSSISISGPSYVFVGRTAQLSLTYEDGSSVSGATWSSDDAYISVSQDGVVTGIAEGNATVRAESGTLSATFEIEVRARQAEDSNVTLYVDTEANDDIRFENGVYYVPLGQTFMVKYDLTDSSYRRFDGVTYTLGSDGESLASYEIEDGVGYFTPTALFENADLTMTGSYSTGTSRIIKSIVVSCYDKNEENARRYSEIVSSISEVESKMVSAHVDYTVGETSTSSDFEIYENAAYVTHEDSEGAVTSREYAHFDADASHAYHFSYNEDLTLDEIYVNSEVSSEEAASWSGNASRAPFYFSNASHFGFASIFSIFGGETSYRGYTAFGDFTAYGYADYTFEENTVTVSSTYQNEDGYFERIFISIFHSSYRLGSYRIEVYGPSETADFDAPTYEESGSSFIYSEAKAPELRPTIDVSRYLITGFSLTSVAGNEDYSYSDTSRYGGALEGEFATVDGVDTYTIANHKALALGLTGVAPSTGSHLLDPVSARGTYTVDGTSYSRDLGPYESESFAFSAPRLDSGAVVETSETVVFSTRGGGSYTIVVNWFRSELEEITVSFPSAVGVVDNAFPDLRLGRDSSYFYLGTDPESATEEFFLDIVSGSSTGLSLVEWPDDNIYGYPGFAYSIHASEVGTYSFRFGVKGYDYEEFPHLYTETYTIEVLPALTAAEITPNIVGRSFVRDTGTMSFTVTFASDSVFTISDGTITESVPYSIANGGIQIAGEAHVFSDEAFYYESILGGTYYFDEAFTRFELYMRATADVEGDQGRFNYSWTSFVVLRESLEGFTGYGETFLYAPIAAMCRFSFTFGADTASLVVTNNVTGETVANISFSYTYDLATSNFSISNVVGDNESLVLSSGYFYSRTVLRFSFSYAWEYGNTTVAIDLNLAQ